jgi:drug/metabolite transporter (DMT)-like permease
MNYGLVFWGAQFVPSGLVAILQAGTPVLALALAFGWFLGSERVSARKVVALVAGLVGVMIIFGAEAPASGPAAITGAIAVFGGSVSVAFAYAWLKTHARHVPRSGVAALQSLAGLLPLAALGFLLEGPPEPTKWTTTGWMAVLYLGVVASVVAFWLNYWLLWHMDASAMLMMGVAEVPIAVGLGAIAFDERLPPGSVIGGTCVLVGVLTALSSVPTVLVPQKAARSIDSTA